ncbi:MAG: SOS response-associated peptidase family protein [Chthoniobacter sp.]|uniref:SOS response-associated peptidase n=1 Tax=Chthoniobacter sp. TaxID=2510640 RepID=UPI0032AABF6C
MCNHYSGDPDRLAEFVRISAPWLRIPAAYSEAPAHMYPKRKGRVVRKKDGVAEMVRMRWGVWPFYAKDSRSLVTNARNDRLTTKAIWKQSVQHRRCLVPATGYFEPGLGPVGARGEVLFKVRERQHFFIAGLWDNDPDQSGESGFTLVTTEPNDYVRPFHDRMPVVLSNADAADWIGEDRLPDARLVELCRGLPSEALIHEEIAAKLPEKLTIKRPSKPAPPPDPQQFLF